MVRQIKSYFLSFLILIPLFSNAQLKDHTKSIDESPPPSQQNLPAQQGDRKTQNDDFKVRSDNFWTDLMFHLFYPILGIVFVPLAPINYHYLGLPNRTQEDPPLPESTDFEFALGSGSSFSVTNLNLKYRIESSSFVLNFDANRERGFSTNFYSLSYVYTPNWKKQFKTGVGIGLKGFNYNDEALQTQGSQTGFLFNFPSEYYFRESKWLLIYTPQATCYFNGNWVFEMRFGVGYELSTKSKIFLTVDNKSVTTKKDLLYGSFGFKYVF